jgi:hypothetical protein
MTSILGSVSKYGSALAGGIAAAAYGTVKIAKDYCPAPVDPGFFGRLFSTPAAPTVVESVCSAVKDLSPTLSNVASTAAPVAIALGCAYVAQKYIPDPPAPRPNPQALFPDPDAPPATPKSTLTKIAEKAPGLGVVAGMATGLLGRVLAPDFSGIGSLVADKSKELCRKAFAGMPLLKAINGLKQWEIKNFALLTPLIPLATKIISDAVRSNDPKNIFAKLWDATKSNLTKEQAVMLALIVTLGLTSGVYAPLLGITSESFDASGHMMLKTLLSHFLSLSLGSIAEKGGRVTQAAAAVFGSLYAFTDSVLVHNTMRACHTAYEAVAGLGWGLGIIDLGKMLF